MLARRKQEGNKGIEMQYGWREREKIGTNDLPIDVLNKYTPHGL